MRRALLLSLASTAVILGACSDQQMPDPVGPEDVEADASLVGNCPSPAQDALLDDIREDIDELFVGRGGNRPATAHIDNIERKLCQELYDDALDMAWGFLGLLTEKNPDEFDGDAQDAAQLASDVFALVGADPNPAGTAFEIPPEVFEPGGTIVTFDPSTASQENPIVIAIDDNVGGEDVAALVVDDPEVFPPGSGLVTVAMYRAPDGVVTTGQTFIPGFAASPVGVEIISSHQPWDQGPGILIALCALGGDVIGHNHEGGVELLVPTDPDPQALGYIVCGDIDDYFGSGGEETIFGYGPDAAPGWARLAHRLVEPLGRFLAPPALNADAVAMGEAGPGLGGRTRSLSLDAPVDAQIEVEESVQLSVGTEAAWTSSNENVATVDANGLVTGVSDGTATIEATFTDVTGAMTTLSMEIRVGSGLEVACFPELSDPVLAFDSVQYNQPTSTAQTVDRYWMSITNYQDYPAELFTITGAYGACGLNQTPSRTWLDIYRWDDETFLQGYCAFDDPADLTAFQVAFPNLTDPPDVFVTLTDRACETGYASNQLDLPNIFILE